MKFKNVHFNIHEIANSGQVFRWYPVDEGYIIIANHSAVLIKQKLDEITLEFLSETKENIWIEYLDLDHNYGEMITTLRGKHPYLDDAMTFGKGIRILKQDPYEMILTYIISANNNIKRITAAVTAISEAYGDFLCIYNGIKYYDFPSKSQLASVDIDTFRTLGVGYRDKYLFEFIQGDFKPDNQIKLSDNELKSNLLRLKGVGEKVANCIMLFGYYRVNQFPIDTWMKKILIQDFDVAEKEIHNFVKTYFTEYGGVAQQYLFYYKRLRNN